METHKDKPNILFVFSDQHRWCDLNCYGNTQLKTPNLDALANQSVRFENCISNSPLCVPARGTLLSGVLPLKHGAAANDLPMREHIESYADVLSSNGYHTGYIGKWHLAGIPRDQFIPEGKGRFGFQEWKVANCTHSYMNSYYHDENNQRYEIEGYEPIHQTNLALEFIERNKEGKPWSLTLSWGPPHDPYDQVPQRYLEMYRDVNIELRDNVPDTILHTRTRTLTKEDIIQNHRGYYSHITALDEQFGRLIHALEETGQLDNTIVVYTSDHGDMLGSQGMTNKQLPYEESIKVPLIVYWKGHTLKGVTRNDLISLVDLPVSLLGLVNLSFSIPVDGADLHNLFTDVNAEGLEACYIFDLIPCHQAYERGSSDWRGIRTKKYMLARGSSDEGFLLYDNECDPFQLNNLINNENYLKEKQVLLQQLDELIHLNDHNVPWQQLIKEFGLDEEWNRSEAYFELLRSQI